MCDSTVTGYETETRRKARIGTSEIKHLFRQDNFLSDRLPLGHHGYQLQQLSFSLFRMSSEAHDRLYRVHRGALWSSSSSLGTRLKINVVKSPSIGQPAVSSRQKCYISGPELKGLDAQSVYRCKGKVLLTT